MASTSRSPKRRLKSAACSEVPLAPDGDPAGAQRGGGENDEVDVNAFPSLRGSEGARQQDDEDALSAAPLQGELREVLRDHQRALREAAEHHEAAMRLGADAVLEALGKELAGLLRGGAALRQPQTTGHGEEPRGRSPQFAGEPRTPQPSAGHPGLAGHSPGQNSDSPRSSALDSPRSSDGPCRTSASRDVLRPPKSKSKETTCTFADVRRDMQSMKTMETIGDVPPRRQSIGPRALARKARNMFRASRSNTHTSWDDPSRRDILGSSSWQMGFVGQLASSTSEESIFGAKKKEFLEAFSIIGGASRRPSRGGALAGIVNGIAFKAIGNLVIIVNSALLVHGANVRVHEDSDSLPLMIAELIFTGWYLLELVLKLTVHRSSYFTGDDRGFNIVDLMLVILSLFDVFLLVFGAWGTIGLDSSFLRTLRVFKVAKILRMFRALRMFNEVRLIMEILMQSMGSLFWAIALLLFLVALFAVFFVQVLGNALHAGSLTDPEEEALLMNFGSVLKAMFSLMQAMSGGLDWMIMYNIVEPLGLLAQVAFVFYIMLMMIAVMNIIAAVYLDKAMEVAKPTLENMMLDKHCQDHQDAKELLDLVSEMDTHHSGCITFSDFMRYMHEDRFRLYFDVRGLNFKDTTMFFKMLASASNHGQPSADTDGEDRVDLNAFVTGCMRLKGVASCMDLYTVGWEIKILRAQQTRFMEMAEEYFSALPAARNAGGAHGEPARPTVDV